MESSQYGKIVIISFVVNYRSYALTVNFECRSRYGFFTK